LSLGIVYTGGIALGKLSVQGAVQVLLVFAFATRSFIP
jgi:hypothetical protein